MAGKPTFYEVLGGRVSLGIEERDHRIRVGRNTLCRFVLLPLPVHKEL